MNKHFMQIVVDNARIVKNDIPVSALIVKNNEIVCICHNEKEEKQSATYHAEILAIQEASKILNSWRLDDCDMYVTLEPCPMCASAIIQARIKHLYFGSFDNLYGALGSKLDLRKMYNSSLIVKGGIMEEECNEILNNYFERMRSEKN